MSSPAVESPKLPGAACENFPTLFPYRRVIMIGTTSSGKSTLSRQLADLLDLDLVELDALHWAPHWHEVPDDIFLQRVRTALASEKWVVAGSYHIARDLIWPHAEVAIWLDYSLWRILGQLTRRIFTRWWTRELLWGTNRENLWTHFKFWSTDSLYHWLFRTYWKRRKEYPELLSQPRYKHLQLIRFKHPGETEAWLQELQHAVVKARNST